MKKLNQLQFTFWKEKKNTQIHKENTIKFELLSDENPCAALMLNNSNTIQQTQKSNANDTLHNNIYACCLCHPFLFSKYLNFVQNSLIKLYFSFISNLSDSFIDRFCLLFFHSRFWPKWDYSKRWNVLWKWILIISIMKEIVWNAQFTISPQNKFCSNHLWRILYHSMVSNCYCDLSSYHKRWIYFCVNKFIINISPEQIL